MEQSNDEIKETGASMNFKKSIITAALVLLTCRLYAEYIFMTDGSIIEGKIVSDAADYIVFQETKGKNKQIKRKNIMRILYTNLNMAKFYIQKRDGQSFVAFIVDEDRDDYLFRKDLYKPEEFKIARKDVLFMSEKNPSALKGEPGVGSIKLSWLAPYGQVKYYNIFMKRNKEDEYSVRTTSGKTEIILTGLEVNASYYFKVTAVDDTDYETNPSNEIQVITKSKTPGSPIVRGDKDDKGNWDLTWEEPPDEDGKVESYRVYTEKDGKYALLKETGDKTAVVPFDTVYDTIHVRSVDNTGDESDPDDYRRDWRFTLSPQFWFPAGNMSEIAGGGFGVTAEASQRDLFMNDLELGISAGWMMVEGKKKIGEDCSNVTSLLMYPLAFFAGYRFPYRFDIFNHYDIISFFPRVSTGLMIMQVDYELLDNAGNVDSTGSDTVAQPECRRHR